MKSVGSCTEEEKQGVASMEGRPLEHEDKKLVDSCCDGTSAAA